MKKIILSLCMVLFVTFSYGQKSKFGLKIGVALSKDIGPKSDTSLTNYFNTLDYKPTLTGGFYINSKVGEYFWLKHEVNYINRGYNLPADSAGTKFRINAHYIDVYPANCAFHFKGGQLFAGPSVSFLPVMTYEEYDADGKVELEKFDLEEINRNIAELGFVAGAEYEFPFGLNLGVRYVRGLTSQYRPEPNVASIKIYSQSWLFSIGYTFGANKKPASVGFD
jgi:hypothetical protein